MRRAFPNYKYTLHPARARPRPGVREQDGVVEDGVDRRRPGRAAADARRPGHGRAVQVREQGPLRLQGRRLRQRPPELHVLPSDPI